MEISSFRVLTSILCNSSSALLCVPHVGVITHIVTMLWDVVLFLPNDSDDQIFCTLLNYALVTLYLHQCPYLVLRICNFPCFQAS